MFTGAVQNDAAAPRKLNMEEGVHMSKREVYEARTEELITPILTRMNFELVDVEYVKEGGVWYLRAYIDKEGGITVNDCEAVAREMNDILDREDYVEESYVFEVSSPGLLRPGENREYPSPSPGHGRRAGDAPPYGQAVCCPPKRGRY